MALGNPDYSRHDEAIAAAQNIVGGPANFYRIVTHLENDQTGEFGGASGDVVSNELTNLSRNAGVYKMNDIPGITQWTGDIIVVIRAGIQALCAIQEQHLRCQRESLPAGS